MIDTSAWQVNNPEWVRKREAQWVQIDQWFDKKGLWSDEFPKGVEAGAYKKYFCSGCIDKHFNYWGKLAFFHPSPGVDTIKLLFDLRRKDYQHQYLLVKSETYYPLQEKGLIAPQALTNTFLAVSGQDYDEMAKNLEFDPVEKLPLATEKLLPTISNWFQYENPDVLPISLLLVHVKSVIKYITPDTLESTKFRLNRFCKRVGNYQPHESTNPDIQTQVANQLKEYLLSNEVDDCVKTIAAKYIQRD